MLAHIELENEVFSCVLTGTLDRIRELRADAPAIRRIVDIGPGPGVGSCILAETFPTANVTAVDSSPAMLSRVGERTTARGIADRVTTLQAELPGGLDGLVDIDLVWASMVLHHIGNEAAALQAIHDVMAPGGIIAIAEFGDPTRVLPDDIGLGRPGLADRIEAVGERRIAAMREQLADSTVSATYPTMLAAAGFEVLDDRVVAARLDGPPTEQVRRLALGHVLRSREQFGDGLDADDLSTLDSLSDPDDPRGVMHRADVVATSSRHVFIAQKPS